MGNPDALNYIAQGVHYLVDHTSHMSRHMQQQAEYGAKHINQLNELYGHWDINQEQRIQFPPYPTYAPYPYQPPSWPPCMGHPPHYDDEMGGGSENPADMDMGDTGAGGSRGGSGRRPAE